MSSIYGPNAKYYIQALNDAFTSRVENDPNVLRQNRHNETMGYYNKGKKLYDMYQGYQTMQASQAAKASADAIQASQLSGQMSGLGTSSTIGSTSSIASEAAPALGEAASLYSAGSGATSAGVASGAGVTGGAATGITASAGGSTAGAVGGSAIGGAGAAGGAAVGSAGSSGSTAAGAGAAGMSGMAIAGPILGLALAIGSAKPGDALFGTKKFMYNTSVGPMMDKADPWFRRNVSGPITPFGTNTVLGRMSGPFGPMSYMHDVMNGWFGNPNTQQAQADALKQESNRLTALKSAFGLQKAKDVMTGQDNDLQP